MVSTYTAEELADLVRQQRLKEIDQLFLKLLGLKAEEEIRAASQNRQ